MKPLPKRKMLDLPAVQEFHDDVNGAIEAGLREGLLHAGVIRDVELSSTPAPVQHDLRRQPRMVLNLGSAVAAAVAFTPHALDPFRYVSITAAPLPVVLDVTATDVGNGLSSTDLRSLTLRAGLLANDGDAIEAQYALTTLAGVDPVIGGVLLGAVVLAAFVAAPAGGDITIRVQIVRTSATTFRSNASIVSSDTAIADAADYVSGTAVMSSALVLKCTGEDAGPTANRVHCRLSTVKFVPGPAPIAARVLIA